jgi:DNA-binding protein YbaB
MWIMKNQKGKIVDVQMKGDDDFQINLDEELLFSEGRELIRDLLIVL